jgi:hypothetical protein
METKCWIYEVRMNDGFGWGDFVITEEGIVAAYTDYENAVFCWGYHGEKGIREFLVGAINDCGNDYLLGKFFSERYYEFDADTTLQRILNYILTERKEGYFDKQRTRKEYDLAREYLDGGGQYDFNDWCRETGIEDGYEYCVKRYCAGVRMFGKELLPLLREKIREELEKENETLSSNCS